MSTDLLITHEVEAHIIILGHQETITLDMLGTAAHDIILGLPQLRKYNPRINQKKNIITFEYYRIDVTTSKPTRKNASLVDKKVISNITSNKVGSKKRITNLIDTNESLLGYEVRVLENRVTPRIPKEYKKQEHLFQEETTIVVLPKH